MFDNTFETETELERITLHVDGKDVPVMTQELGLMLVRDNLEQGVMSYLKIERAFYCKDAWAMSQDGEWQYKYFLVWRQVN